MARRDTVDHEAAIAEAVNDMVEGLPLLQKRMFCDRRTFSISAQIQFSSQFLPPLFLSPSQVKRCQRLGKRVSAHSTESDRKGSPSPPPPPLNCLFSRLRHAPGGDFKRPLPSFRRQSRDMARSSPLSSFWPARSRAEGRQGWHARKVWSNPLKKPPLWRCFPSVGTHIVAVHYRKGLTQL